MSVQDDLFAVAFPPLPWMDEAACTKEDPELFFPPRRDQRGHYAETIAKAKAVCRSCPVVGECLEFALKTADHHAILGATTPAERGTSWRRYR